MYNGSNKTALTSQQNIARAMLRLMEDMPYTAISISAICKEADISRQTFYTLFESKDNIILYVLQKKHCFHPGTTCDESSLTLQDLCSEYAAYMVDKKDVLSLLVKNGISYMLHDSLFDTFHGCSCCSDGHSATELDFIAEFWASALSGIAQVYIKNQDTLTEKDLSKIIFCLLSGDYMKESFD